MARVNALPAKTNGTEKLRLILADAHPLALKGMQHVLESESDFVVVACCSTAAETVETAIEHHPDVLILDFHLPDRGSMRVLQEIATSAPQTRVVLLASSLGEHETLEAVRLGVKGIVLTELAVASLAHSVRRVARGQMWIENGSFAGVVSRLARHDTQMHDLRQRLTRREMEVVQLVAEGLRNKDITARLAISEGTVKIHLHNIYGKLGTNDRVQLALRARDERIA
jgi:DNA-binding NarL/FixJ family response regulator